MKLLIYDTHDFEKPYLEQAAQDANHQVSFLDAKLTPETAKLAEGFRAICVFVNDRVNSEVLGILKEHGIQFVLLRSAGFNHVDLKNGKELGIKFCRVPKYSPYAVAEHTVALLLVLNRKIPRGIVRVKELNFSLNNLVGFDLFKKVIGVIGTGRIGSQVCRILRGFGCEVLAVDQSESEELKRLGVRYVPKVELLSQSDVITLHVPLTPETQHMIDESAIQKMKSNALIINTSRGALVSSNALIQALKTKKIAGAALDVYEEEENLFFSDHSNEILQDDLFARLLTFPNVIITAHQAFLTQEALKNIAETTFKSLTEIEKSQPLTYLVEFKGSSQ